MSNVCQNQEIFNKAFETAADTYKVEEINKMTKGKIGTIYTIMTIIYLIFIIWAVILAMRVEKKESRILHVTLALIAGPAYVFGYYLSI
jgi:hypothetical protein